MITILSGLLTALALLLQASSDAPERPQTSGTASWVAPAYGTHYLALPAGRGIRVTICGKAACVTRTSTDAGPVPSLHRVADLSYADFRKVCGCDPVVVGVTHVTITGAPELPATDR